MRRGAVLAAVVAALFLLHLVLSRSMDGFLLADGTGYLANARWIAGKAGATWQGPAAFYNAGWSALVAPIYLLTRAPDAVHTGVLLLNAALASVSFLAYAALAETAFGLGRRAAILAGLVAATYPAVLLQASFEWSESLFHLLFPLLLLAAHRLLRKPSEGAAIATALAAAGLNATHPKGLGAVAVVGVALAVLGWRRSIPARVAFAGLAAMVLAFLATRALHGALQDAMYAESSAAIEGDVLGRLTDPTLVYGAFRAFWGQLWYATVASVGLVPLGVVALARHADRRFAAVALGTSLSILAASCLQMSDGTRVDHMVYGRYDEGFLPALLVAAVAALVVDHRRVLRLAPVAAALAALGGILTVVLNGGDKFAGNVMPLNVVGVLVYSTDTGRIDVLTVTVLAGIVLGVAWLVARRSVEAGVVALVAFFVASSVVVEARTIRPWEDRWSSYTEIPAVVHRIGFEGPIGYDLATYDVDAADAYQLELTDVGALLFFDSRTSEHLPGSDLVIAGPTWRSAGARIAFIETGPYEQTLWVRPGELQQRLDQQGLLLPEQHSAPLADAAQRAELGVERDGDELTVRVRNDGAAWLPAGLLPGVVEGTVRVSARWYDGDDEVASQTADLPRLLLPGDEADVAFDLTELDVAPGTYRVVVSLRQESVAYWDASAVELELAVE